MERFALWKIKGSELRLILPDIFVYCPILCLTIRHEVYIFSDYGYMRSILRYIHHGPYSDDDSIPNEAVTRTISYYMLNNGRQEREEIASQGTRLAPHPNTTAVHQGMSRKLKQMPEKSWGNSSRNICNYKTSTCLVNPTMIDVLLQLWPCSDDGWNRQLFIWQCLTLIMILSRLMAEYCAACKRAHCYNMNKSSSGSHERIADFCFL